MTIEQYDPFALKQYAFTLQKTNNYFTFITIFLSLGIIATSIVMNMDVISHLWLPRIELPTSITTAQQYPSGPLTSTLFCYTYLNVSANYTYPPFKAFDTELN
jgi:hypothetical protein